MAQKNVEKRFLSSAVEVRSEEGKPPVVEGYAAVFDQETVIGGAFAERVAPGAFDGADMSNTVALFNHNIDQPLARVGRGLELTVDERGLKYRFELGNQSYAKDLAENIRMGNVSTSSFGFTVREDDWERRDDGVNLRIIKGVDLLFDVSPTTQGAYPTTEVGLRSMELAFANEEVMNIEQEEVREEEVVAEEATAAPEQKEDCGCDGKNVIPAVQRSEEELESEEVRAEMDGAAEEEEEQEAQPVADAEEEEGEEERTVETEVILADPDLVPNAYGLRNQNVEPEARSQNSKSEEMSDKTKSAPAYVQGLGDTEMHVSKRYSFGKAIKEAAQGRLTGLEAEMNQEARQEFSSSKINVSGGFSVPSIVMRADDLPLGTGVGTFGSPGAATAAAFGGTIGVQDAGLVAAFRPQDIATQLGARSLTNLTGDVVFQVQNKEIAAEKLQGTGTTGAAVASAEVDVVGFTPVTLSPTRYSAYSKVTEQMLAQSADDMGAFIASDIRKAVEAKFNDDIVTAIKTAASSHTSPASLPAYNQSSRNPLHLESELLGADVDLSTIRCLASAVSFRTARTLSLDSGSGMLMGTSPLDRLNVIGYNSVVSSSVTTGELYFVDNSQMIMGTWGGVNIMVDPYTDANNGVVRIIANVYKSFKTLQNDGFRGVSSMPA
jgi:HK97 family phage prohead protease